MALLHVLSLLVFLYWSIQAVLRFVGPRILFILFGLVPGVMCPYWVAARDFDLFIWIKLLSVFVCVCWGTWHRFGRRDAAPWTHRITLWLLVANIAEAVCVDVWAIHDRNLHLLNVCAGVLLIMQLIVGSPRICIRVDKSSRDLEFDLPFPWIVGYTLWNLTFVALNYPAYLGHHTAVLIAALLVAILDRRLWVQARAATLATNLLWMALSPSLLLKCCDTSDCPIELIRNSLAVLATSWIIAVSLMRSCTVGSLNRFRFVVRSYLLGSSMTPVQLGGATRRF